MKTRWLCLHIIAALATGCGGDDTGPFDSAVDSVAADDMSVGDALRDGTAGDAGSDGSGVTCEIAPTVDTSWFGGSLLYCGFGTEACGATATPTGPCLCTQEWSSPSTGSRCGGAVVSPDGSHTYLASCDPQSGTCRCSFDGDECYCRAKPARPCSDLCQSGSRGCLCGTLPDGTPSNRCIDMCQDVPGLVECCADPDASGACFCDGEPRSDICERSLNCCWTGGNEI